MLISKPSRHSTARRAIQKADLEQVRLIDLFYRILFLTDRRRQSSETDWTAVKLSNNRHKELAVHFIKAKRIYFHAVERLGGHISIHVSIVKNLGDITNAPQQPVCYSGGAARPFGDFVRSARIHGNAKDV